MYDKSTRSYFFRALVAKHDDEVRAHNQPMILTWTEARRFYRAATAAAIYRALYSH